MATAPKPPQSHLHTLEVVCGLQPNEAKNLIAAYGLVIVGIETDIVAKDRALAIAVACVGAVTPAVDMPMQHNGATCLAVPAEHGVVAHNQTMALGIAGSNLQVIAHVFPNLRYVGIFPVAVMVTADERHVLTFDTLAQTQVFGGETDRAELVAESTVTAYLLPGEQDRLRRVRDGEKFCYAPVVRAAAAGTVEYRRGDAVIASDRLKYGGEVLLAQVKRGLLDRLRQRLAG